MADRENGIDDINEYYGGLDWHKQNDKPSDHFTPIWNNYIKSGCVARMTKEEALKQGMFFMTGGLEEAVKSVEKAREYFFNMNIKGKDDPKVREQWRKYVINRFPYEFLFVYLM